MMFHDTLEEAACVQAHSSFSISLFAFECAVMKDGEM